MRDDSGGFEEQAIGLFMRFTASASRERFSNTQQDTEIQ